MIGVLLLMDGCGGGFNKWWRIAAASTQIAVGLTGLSVLLTVLIQARQVGSPAADS
jgi:hypothetical protein